MASWNKAFLQFLTNFCHIWRFFNVPQQPQTVHYIRCALFWNILKYSKNLGGNEMKILFNSPSTHFSLVKVRYLKPDFWVPVLPLKCKAVFFFLQNIKKKLSQYYYYLCEDCRKFLFCTLIVINAIVVLQNISWKKCFKARFWYVM